MPRPQTPNHAMVEQAADWLVRLTADDTNDHQRRQLAIEFSAWKQQDPLHAAAAQRMEDLLSRLHNVQQSTSPKIAHNVLETTSRAYHQRRKLHRASALCLILLCVLLPSWMLIQGVSLNTFLNDFSTRKGQWQSYQLSDGSQLNISGQTAVNYRFSEHERLLELQYGKILVDVAKDTQRPFVIKTAQGTVQALGTKFTVEKIGNTTEVTLLESRVRVSNQQHTHDMKTGEQLRFTPLSIAPRKDIDPFSQKQAWDNKLMVLNDDALVDALEQLSRHYVGIIRYNKQALSSYRASGILPLDNAEQALHLLAESLNLKVRYLTPWLVFIQPNA